MKAELKGLHSPDIGLADKPGTGALDCILVQLMIGPKDGPGEESFDVTVCTPQWLERQVVAHGPQRSRHFLFVAKVDLAVVEEYVNNYLSLFDEPTWPELAAKIGRLGKWEFEDYRA